MSPSSLSLASFSISETPPWHTMFNSPATSSLKSNCLNLTSAFPKLLYLGPRLSLGHWTLDSVSESLSESELKPLNLDLPVFPCDNFEQQWFDWRRLSLHLLVCFTRDFGPSDSLESDGSTRAVADTPSTLRALSASAFTARLSLRSPIVTVRFGFSRSAHSDLALTFVVFFRLRSLFCRSLPDPEQCCRAPPDGARNTLSAVRVASDSSVTLDSSSGNRWFSRSNWSSILSFFWIRIWSESLFFSCSAACILASIPFSEIRTSSSSVPSVFSASLAMAPASAGSVPSPVTSVSGSVSFERIPWFSPSFPVIACCLILPPSPRLFKREYSIDFVSLRLRPDIYPKLQN